MASASISVGSSRRLAKIAAVKNQIVVIDPQKLRQAALVRLLEDWAERNELRIVAISAPHDLGLALHCAIVVLSVGGASVLEDGTQFWMRLARSALAHAPLVILSDREERSEIRAAFDQGARGFVVTNLEPALALEALNFLRRGGSFFPPSTIGQEHQSPPVAPMDAPGQMAPMDAPGQMAPMDAPGQMEAPLIAGGAKFRVSARVGTLHPSNGDVREGGAIRATLSLTPREHEVLERLREGKANKLIARDLHMTEATVKVHMRQIMRKLGVANRTQAVLCATGIAATREESDR